jgi:hypothetical protein
MAVADCAERYPVTAPFDAGWPPSHGPMEAQPGAPSPVRAPDDVVIECAAQAGTNCDVGSFLSQLAARCIAQATAPEPLLEPEVGFRTPWLGFNADSRRVEWSVTAGICCGDTWLFHVDASNGLRILVSHTEPPRDCTALCDSIPIEGRESDPT